MFLFVSLKLSYTKYRNKTRTKKQVKVGDIREDKIQVLEGLEDGEVIVVKGQYGLLDGEKVNARRVVEND